jgi:hypothetical protein
VDGPQKRNLVADADATDLHHKFSRTAETRIHIQKRKEGYAMVLKPLSVIFALVIGSGCFFSSKSVADQLNLIDYSRPRNAQCDRFVFSFRQRDRPHPALGPRAYGSAGVCALCTAVAAARSLRRPSQ